MKSFTYRLAVVVFTKQSKLPWNQRLVAWSRMVFQWRYGDIHPTRFY